MTRKTHRQRLEDDLDMEIDRVKKIPKVRDQIAAKLAPAKGYTIDQPISQVDRIHDARDMAGLLHTLPGIPTGEERARVTKLFYCVSCYRDIGPGKAGRKCHECRDDLWKTLDVLDWSVESNFRPPYGDLFDANGEEILLPVMSCNRKTGEVVYRDYDANGKVQYDEAGKVRNLTTTLPAPLRFVPAVG